MAEIGRRGQAEGAGRRLDAHRVNGRRGTALRAVREMEDHEGMIRCPYCHRAAFDVYVVVNSEGAERQRFWCKSCHRTAVMTDGRLVLMPEGVRGG